MNHEELKIFKKFYEENKQISDQIECFPIDLIKKQQFIDKHIDSTDKSIVTELVNSVKHVGNIEFESLIKELCDKYNEVKDDNDIYILLYIGNMGSGSGGRWYNEKSSFYVTNIAAKYLKYDNIIDITTKDIFICDIDVSKQKIFNDIKNLSIAENKNIYLYFCDDCSYGGQQLMLIITNFMNSLKESLSSSLNCFYYRFIIPFILNKQVYSFVNYQSTFTNLIKDNFDKKSVYLKIDETIIEYQTKHNCNPNNIKNDKYQDNIINDIFKKSVFTHCNMISTIINTFTINRTYLIDILPIADILIKNNSMIRETNDIIKNESIETFGKKYLIYFDHKFADEQSINQKMIPPIIGNCNYSNDIDIFPPAGYKKIIYKLNGIPIIFDQTKTLLEQLIFSIQAPHPVDSIVD
jgi:hypothetical protein